MKSENHDREKIIRAKYDRMVKLKDEISAQLGKATLTGALYEDRECGLYSGINDGKKDELARSSK